MNHTAFMDGGPVVQTGDRVRVGGLAWLAHRGQSVLLEPSETEVVDIHSEVPYGTSIDLELKAGEPGDLVYVYVTPEDIESGKTQIEVLS